ncbi:MAG: TonB-dependent receptor, partial [Muribaculum sp.]|nr:TonB-dependent receptor [Muribaculum sp.]
GSQMTSTIYVRGLGSRIDQAAVGMNLDNVPVLNKETYDFELIDIDSIEVVRGPQALMYGRNTMDGIINIHSLSPMKYQGLRATAELSSGLTERFTAGYYTRIAPKLAMSVSGGLSHCDGFWINDYNGKNTGRTFETRGRWRTIWQPLTNLTIDNVATVDYARQSGYPYEFIETGRIAYNDTCFYRRTTFTDGLLVSALLGKVQLNSVTSFQYVNDNLTLDQDFTPDDYFTLTQRRHEWAITQDITLSGHHGVYSWLAGISGFYRRTGMTAPVDFKKFGIEELILSVIPPEAPIAGWAEDSFILATDLVARNRSIALYHQSSVNLDRWILSAGLRFDLEQAMLNYLSETHTVVFISTPRGPVRGNIDMIIPDRLRQTFREFSPKFTVSYNLPAAGNTVYATVSRGYKAGGYNTQMFSDILKEEMKSTWGEGSNYERADIISYRPERSMNYEIGYNGSTTDKRLSGSLTLFWMDIRDQQLTAFPPGTNTGRIMTNAGRTRSRGLETSISYRPLDELSLSASYGFTDARFRHYVNGTEKLDGKRVPYAPAHTLFLSATWRQNLGLDWFKTIDFNANLRGIGPIYWDESNTVKQNLYTLFGARR